MFNFSIDKGNSLPQYMEIEVQGPKGENLGVMDIFKVKELIYAGKFKGKEIVRPLNGEWSPIGDLAPLRLIFKMMGIDLVAVKVHAQQIKGWKTKDKKHNKTKAIKTENTEIIKNSTEQESVGSSKLLISIIIAVSAIAAIVWLI